MMAEYYRLALGLSSVTTPSAGAKLVESYWYISRAVVGFAVSSCYLRTYQSVTNVRNVYSLTWLVNALRTCIGRTSMVSSGIGREK